MRSHAHTRHEHVKVSIVSGRYVCVLCASWCPCSPLVLFLCVRERRVFLFLLALARSLVCGRLAVLEVALAAVGWCECATCDGVHVRVDARAERASDLRLDSTPRTPRARRCRLAAALAGSASRSPHPPSPLHRSRPTRDATAPSAPGSWGKRRRHHRGRGQTEERAAADDAAAAAAAANLPRRRGGGEAAVRPPP